MLVSEKYHENINNMYYDMVLVGCRHATYSPRVLTSYPPRLLRCSDNTLTARDGRSETYWHSNWLDMRTHNYLIRQHHSPQRIEARPVASASRVSDSIQFNLDKRLLSVSRDYTTNIRNVYFYDTY
ncbi:MAG: hypothetical protein J07HQX50_00271 [Haloquadratum sp. J07HQX50]|nr:MAG: hypothetical protein J07HQX50_00271 [Haloquadratum sp. J07HQX50]